MFKFFDQNKAAIKKLNKKFEEVELFAKEIESLSDDELQGKTEEFKERIEQGETLDDLQPEAFAVCREAAKRVLGLYPYPVQIMGSAVLHDGDIAEMKTGEGKTLTATMAVYLNALLGKGVHVVTVNEYLSERDAKEMGQLYEWLGLTVGINKGGMSAEEKRQAYLEDITYSTNSELGFDYLRDNMAKSQELKVQRPLHFAVIDEVDSVLIDEARTPLIIASNSKSDGRLYLETNKLINFLSEEDYKYDVETNDVMLTEKGIEKTELAFKIDNLFNTKHSALNHAINQSLKAHMTLHLDSDYVVQDGEIMIVDSLTGRILKGRRYGDGLHQALEAKENLEIKRDSVTLAKITFQNYFRKYEKLSGMTGTAKTEEEEFKVVYNMDVISIPTNKPIARIDNPDLVYGTLEAKFNAVVEDVKQRHEKGQPVLIGTVTIETSELISSLLDREGIPHTVLNAKNHENEAKIIADAGQQGAVTVATNMAGRGTDIKPGDGVLELGGLAVIGTERHESRRIDNQLRGRSGRQGNIGETQFYLSLEDDMLIRLGAEKMKSLVSKLGIEDSKPIKSKMITKAIESAQTQTEGRNFDARKVLLQYDDVLREQREIIYAERDEALTADNTKEIVLRMIDKVIDSAVDVYDETGDVESLLKYSSQNLEEISEEEIEGKNTEEIKELLREKTRSNYEEKENRVGSQNMSEFEHMVLLRSIDTHWESHIDAMEDLLQGIHLNAYAQIDPLREYSRIGFEMFDETTFAIREYVARSIMKTDIRLKTEEEKEVSSKDE